MFFYVSLVLVIVAAVTLVIGLLSSGLGLVLVSIGSSFLAGVFLIATVLRERPRVEIAVAGPEPQPEPARHAAAASVAEGAPEAEWEEEEFPIADYDELKVSEILPLLPELDDDELELVRRREEQGKARASILNRIDDLLGIAPAPKPAPKRPAAKKVAAAARATDKAAFPIPNYDALAVADISKRLAKLSVDELKRVRTYEKRKKARKGVLERIELELSRR